MKTATQPAATRWPLNLVSTYPGGWAWPANDDRRGRYVMASFKAAEPFRLGVVDDFGDLVEVPSYDISGTGCCAMPMQGGAE